MSFQSKRLLLHDSPLPVAILIQINPVHTLYPTALRTNVILYSHSRPGLPSGLFPSGFPTKDLYAPILSPLYAS